MRQQLAIVIPAFKPQFLGEALNSLAKQTNKDFRVYISNDGGPPVINTIAAQYTGQLDLVYHRFEDNLGKTDLVGHWNRSVRLADEEWIWLFSDDDMMTDKCVEAFYRVLGETAAAHRLYRLNIEMIDGKGDIILTKSPHPEAETAYEFLVGRLRAQTLSAAVEYIFRKDDFLAHRGFVNFPMAYCADDASWLVFSGGKPIRTIPGEKVFWRASGANISAGHQFAFPKAKALLLFVDFITRHYPEKRPELLTLAKTWFFKSLVHIRGRLNPVQCFLLARRYTFLFGGSLKEPFLNIFALQLRYTRLANSFEKWQRS
jgi:glycosyltransferase involved in cell wall biosynthesis